MLYPITKTEKFEIIRCPFCGYHGIEVKPGKTVWPECEAEFEIDDCGECVFVDPNNPTLPIEGIICLRCGLVQREEGENCAYCRARSIIGIQ